MGKFSVGKRPFLLVSLCLLYPLISKTARIAG